MDFNVELVGKIGSMALIDKENQNINYNLFARLGRELKPGYVWVTSGATEIGRIDYINRAGHELKGAIDDVKADYAAQGQAILIETYRQFINPDYSIRQILVEHQHFNDHEKCEFLKSVMLRAVSQNAIPIINYNDAVSNEENRKNEIRLLESEHKKVVECIDNDETAAQVAVLLRAKTLLILTSTDGIYRNYTDPSSLIEKITAEDYDKLIAQIDSAKLYCTGASRAGANGAKAKLEYTKEPLRYGTKVIIANAKYPIRDILSGNARRTEIGINI